MAGDVEECEDEQHHPPEPRNTFKRQFPSARGDNADGVLNKDEKRN